MCTSNRRHVLSAGLLCVFAGHAAATDIYVSLSGDDANPGTEALPLATIDAAVAAAADGDTIFIKPGLYEGAEHGDYTINFNLSFVGDGPAGSVVLSGGASFDPFGPDATFLEVFNAGVSARNIVFRNFKDGDFGAVFRVVRSSITLESCEFRENVGFRQGGGAIWLNGAGRVTITDCFFDDNASLDGGGMGFGNASVGSSIGGSGFATTGAGANGEPITISGCTFTNEGSSISLNSLGGPITMADCVVTACRGDVSAITFGGDAAITIVDCLFERNNTLDLANGGDEPAALTARGDTILIDRSVFFRNTARGQDVAGCNPSNGGAVFLRVGDGNTAEVRNSIFVGNQAPWDGPEPCVRELPDPGNEARGNAISANRLRIVNSTFAYNQDLDLPFGPEPEILAANPIFVTESVTIENSVFFEPTGVFGDQVPPSATISGSFTIVDEGFAGFTVETAPGFVNAPASPDAISFNFDNDAFKLAAASPAIDAGSNAAAPGPDLDGNARIADGDNDGTAIVDLGAYEFGSAAPCAVDLDANGLLSTADINLFVRAFLANDPAADLNADGSFNNTDIDLFVQFFLAGCG